MIVEKADEVFSDFRIPGIVATEKGTLLRYCECRRTRSDWADIDLKVCRSTDGGESWQTVFVVNSEGNTLNNPVMIVDGDRIIFLYCKNYKEIYKKLSLDDGMSFSDSERVAFEDSIDFFYNVVAVGPGHGIKHGDRLLVPMWFAHNSEDEKAHHPSTIATLYSDDRGESFRVGEVIFKDKLVNPSECALAVDTDNGVLISIRHEGEKKLRALAESPDGVSSWHSLRFEGNLSDPVCMGSMTHKDGVIYHVNCDSQEKRRNIKVKISEDRFRSFKVIDISEKGGYSDIALLGDKICVFYETLSNEGAWELNFCKI